MGAPEALGHITEKWWQTKKILDWKYESPMSLPGALMEKFGPPVATVSLEQSRGSDEDDKIWFVARSNWFGGAMRRHETIRDRTLEGLKAKVEQCFHDQLVAHTDVKWEDWLEVEIAERDVKSEEKKGSAYIHVEYKVIKRARFPDGRDMILEGNTLARFPKAKAAGVETDRGERYQEYYQDSDHQFAYIPATPENLEAVHELMRKLGEVNERLMTVLAQGNIRNTVKLLTGGHLLLEKK